LGLAAWLTFGLRFGVAFGLLSGLGLLLVYMLRFAPSDEYQALAKPHLTSRKLLGTFLHGSAIGIAGILAGTLTRQGLRGPLFGLEVGLVVAAVGAIVATLSPFIEWWADRLPERRLGIFGAILVFAGFALHLFSTGPSCSTSPSDRESRRRKVTDVRQARRPRAPVRFCLS
jgi:hypothetical protein